VAFRGSGISISEPRQQPVKGSPEEDITFLPVKAPIVRYDPSRVVAQEIALSQGSSYRTLKDKIALRVRDAGDHENCVPPRK
jgi:hypothetical protein